MDKRGWLKIVEVFTTILLIIGVLLIITNRVVYEREDIQENIYEAEVGILREIQLDETLRESILNLAEENLPIESDTELGELNPGFPQDIRDLILDKKPDYLNCKAKICSASDAECHLDSYGNKDTYAQSVIITVLKTSADYTPKKLKVFCWIKG